MTERWKRIPGYDAYEISDKGRVRSYRFHSKGVPSPRYIAPGVHPRSGYQHVTLWDAEKRRRTYLIHRLVLHTFVGEAPRGHECAHLNGIGSDNRLENLRWMTRVENHGHKLLHGTHGKVLTNQQVQMIRKCLRVGAVGKHLACAFGVSADTIYAINSGKLWSKLKDSPV